MSVLSLLPSEDVIQGGEGHRERLQNLGRGPMGRNENFLARQANQGLASSAGHPSPQQVIIGERARAEPVSHHLAYKSFGSVG